MVRMEVASSSPSGEAKQLLGQGEEEMSDGDRNPRHRRTSWRDVVGQNLPVEAKTYQDHIRVSGSPRGRVQASSPTKPTTQKLFSKEEVLEILRESNLRGAGRNEDGWTQVVSKANMKKANAQAREMLGVSKKKRKLACWECKETGHISADCPLGVTCLFAIKPATVSLIVQGTNQKTEGTEASNLLQLRMKKKK